MVARIFVVLAVVVWELVQAGQVLGQCMLANPSFEVPGSAGSTFGGWNQFGTVGSSSTATHGHAAARVTSPNIGNWAVSAYWQRLDTAPGQRWAASARVWHSPSRPLAGQSRAILNIEWRNASGDLISYESHTVADAATPPGQVIEVSAMSQSAPAGAVATHFLLGVLQGPTDPVADVFYDQATFDHLGPPTLEERQWLDFPGGRTLDFSGRTWRVKGPGYYGPGPSQFCDGSSCVWLDTDDRLHLTIKRIAGTWYSTEVALVDPLGYGDYIFTTVGRLDLLDPAVVLGFFLWQYGPCYDPGNAWWNPYNECDVEFSRWGTAGSDVGQFVTQPYNYPGNASRFDATFADGERTSHAFRWLHDRIEFRSWRGGPLDESPASLIHSWTYSGVHIPRAEQPRAHMNMWQFNAAPSTNQEVVIEEFRFVPHEVVGVLPDLPAAGRAATLFRSRPSPFHERTTIQYALPAAGRVEITIHDVAGRRVRTLVNALTPAGIHEAVWDARDEFGTPVSPGVFIARLRSGGAVETRRLVLLK
ncbi:MAG TPA: FlgD immunoglobulin-like domain containing protein [Candidatus Eisenbacteria bacterium]|nr:FlgD immunoglobulin-like domain containing protein [Candidatus Eisenbacteria bacterium]